MKKILYVGDAKVHEGARCRYPVFLKLEIRENGVLTISGVHGPTKSGNAHGGCGQIYDTIAKIDRFAAGWDKAKADELVRVWDKWHLNDVHPECEHQRADANFEAERTAIIAILTYRLTSEAEKAQKSLEERVLYAALKDESLTLSAQEKYLLELPYNKKVYDLIDNVIGCEGGPANKYNPDPAYYEQIPNTRHFHSDFIKQEKACWVHHSETPLGYLLRPCPCCGYKYGSAWNKVELPQSIIDWAESLPVSARTPNWV